ncbi:MAG: DUF3006 domain-containing protein [Candidatus Uhrbacteria bacterium]
MDVTIDRFEDDRAVLILESGDSVIVPRAELPDEATEGDVIALSFGINDTETDDRTANAKAILNEILGTDDTPHGTGTDNA